MSSANWNCASEPILALRPKAALRLSHSVASTIVFVDTDQLSTLRFLTPRRWPSSPPLQRKTKNLPVPCRHQSDQEGISSMKSVHSCSRHGVRRTIVTLGLGFALGAFALPSSAQSLFR